MGQAETQPGHYSVEEYLEREVRSEVRHNFVDGRILERSGDTATNNLLVGNCVAAFRQSLRGSSYRVYALGVLLVLQEGRHYTYPNLLVCPAGDGPGEPALMRQPHLLLEVLSPETADFDRAVKFNQYRQLPSLRHYLLVSQKTWLVEWYRLTEHGVWAHTALADADDAVAIPELGLTLTLAEVYEEAGMAPVRPGVGGPEPPAEEPA